MDAKTALQMPTPAEVQNALELEALLVEEQIIELEHAVDEVRKAYDRLLKERTDALAQKKAELAHLNAVVLYYRS